MDSKKSVKAVLAALAVTSLFTSVNTIYAADQSQDKAKDKNAENAVKGQANQDSLYNMVALLDGTKTKSTATTTAPVATTAANVKADAPKEDTTTDTQNSVMNNQGFYVQQDTTNGGKAGVYNSLTKDGLWVGGTSDDTGFHVDNAGNAKTTGNITADGTVQAHDVVMTTSDMFSDKTYTNSFDAAGLVPGQSQSKYSTAIGHQAFGNPSIGKNANQSVAIGDAVQIKDGGEKSTAIGYGSTIGDFFGSAKQSVAVGANSSVSKDYGVAIGESATVNTQNGIAIGQKATIGKGAVNSVAIGGLYEYSEEGGLGGGGNELVAANAKNSTVIGAATLSQSEGGTALGKGARVGQNSEASLALGVDSSVEMGTKNAVALGANSVADKENTVSVGSDTLQRKIVNVADGTVAKGSTDAVTGGQLFTTNENLAAETKARTDADQVFTDKFAAYEKSGVVAGETFGENSLALGKDSLAGSNAIALGQHAQSVNNGAAVGQNATANGDNSLALGNTAVVTGAGVNSVALGNNSFADEANVVSVGGRGVTRKIVNVADGTIEEGSHDAVTGGQLYTTNQAIGDVSKLEKAGFVDKDDEPIDNVTDAVIKNKTNIQGNTTNINRLSSKFDDFARAGVVVSIDDNAKYPANQNSLQLGNQASATGKQSVALGYSANTNGFDNSTAIGAASQTNGKNTVALGTEVTVFGDNTVVIGANSEAFDSGDLKKDNRGNNTVIGTGASVDHVDNAVALGAGSIANEANTVSVGTAENKRKITNVADGVAATDAATVGQISKITGTDTVKGAVVQYDKKADGKTDYSSVTLKGDNGTALKNVSDIELGGKSFVESGLVPGEVNGKSYATAIGNGASVQDGYGTALGAGAKSVGAQSTAIGAKAQTSGSMNSTAVGGNSQAIASGATAVGAQSSVSYSSENGSAFGANSHVYAKNGTALGNGSRAFGDDSVALGYNSRTQADEKGVVSVGDTSSNLTRKIINVTDGTIAKDSHDAVTGGQLYTEQEARKSADKVLTDKFATYEAAGIVPGKVNGSSKATALGNGSSATAEATTALGANANAGDGTTNPRYATAVGANSTALSEGATAIGSGATVQTFGKENYKAFYGTALGTNATVEEENGTALGAATSVTAKNAVALGKDSVADEENTVSVGRKEGFDGVDTIPGIQRRITNVAAGDFANDYDAVTTGQLKASGIVPGFISAGKDSQSVAISANARLLGNDTVLIGGNSDDKENGYYNAITADKAVVIGQNIKATSNSVALGYGTNATGDSSVALGKDAKATIAQATAIGAGSIADEYNTVSVGSKGHERKITNVDDGVNDFDAVNKKQLNAVDTKVTGLSDSAVQYDKNEDGTTNYDSVTFKGKAWQGTDIKNVGDIVLAGKTTYGQDLSYAKAGITPGYGSDLSKDGIVSLRGNATGMNAIAIGTNAGASQLSSISIGTRAHSAAEYGVALGEGTWIDPVDQKETVKGDKGSVALGAGSTVTKEDTKNGTIGVVSVGSGDKDSRYGATRKIINVADGTVAKGSTDAVTGGQLFDVSQKVTDLDSLAVKYDDATKGSVTFSNTTLKNVNDVEINLKGGSRGLVSSGITPGTVYATADGWSDGAAADTASLAIGGGQVGSMTSAANVRGKNSIAIGANSQVTVEGAEELPGFNNFETANNTAVGVGSNITGIQGTAVGYGATVKGNQGAAFGDQANAEANKASAFGESAVASAANSTALGQGASVGTGADNSVALGAGSVVFNSDLKDTDKNGVVSVGSGNAERRIIHVADGTVAENSHDAVTGGQLFTTNENLAAETKARTDADTVFTDKFKAYEDAGIKAGHAEGATDDTWSLALGEYSSIVGPDGQAKINSVAVGVGANVQQDNSTAVGTNANNNGNFSTSVGEEATGAGDYATALGGLAYAYKNGTAVGTRALAEENSVALGADSIAKDKDVVSVGHAKGDEYTADDGSTLNYDSDLNRKIVNVADGKVAEGSHDAVTGGQLFDVSQKVTDLDSLAVKYDDATKGSVTFSNTTLKNVNDVEINLKGGSRGLVSSGITPGTVYATADGWSDGAAADTASLAIGGGLQNSQTTSATVRGKNSIAIGSGASVDATAQELDAPLNGFDNADGVAIGVGANVSGIQGTAVGYDATVKENQGTAFGNQSAANGNKATAIGFSAVADADNSTVLGQGASVGTGADNSVALGAGSVVFNSDLKDTDKNGVVSVGSGNAERRIIHVADGVDAHDAVNKGQLDTLSSNAVQYDKNDDGTTNYDSVTFKGSGTVLNNVKDIALPAYKGHNSTFVGSGLVNGVVYDTTSDKQWTENGSEATSSVAIGRDSNVRGTSSLAVGIGATVGTGDNSTVIANGTALGSNAKAGGQNGTAVGEEAEVAGDNGAAFGYQAKAEADSTAIGTNATAGYNGDGEAVAIGKSANVQYKQGIALGNNAEILADKGTALGYGAQVSWNGKNSVALGAGSIANDENVVSVGREAGQGGNISNPAITRRIVNVADGTVAEGSTDAVTGGQLFTTNENLAAETKARTDADKVFTDKFAAYDNTGINGGVVEDDAKDSGSVAIGQGSHVYGDDLLTSDKNGVVSFGQNDGFTDSGDEVTRRLIHVGTGINDSDAATVGQTVHYDLNKDKTINKDSVTLGGTYGTDLNNVGDIKFYTSRYANNTMSFKEAGITPGLKYGKNVTADNVVLGPEARIVGYDQVDKDSKASVGESVVIGNNAQVYAATQSTAIGGGATVYSEHGTALGNGARVGNDTGASVSLGADSNVDKVNLLADGSESLHGVVSVGKSGDYGFTRRIINVKDGINDTDAATVGQVKAADKVFTDAFAAYEAAGITPGTVNDGDYNVALGNGATVTGGNANTAIGEGTTVDGAYNVALGYGASTQNGAENSIAIGYFGEANAKNSIAIGQSAKANKDKATAIGDNTKADYQGVALGANANASAVNGVAIGADSVASGGNSTALGYASKATGSQATALGQNAQALAEQSVALGEDSIATEKGTVSVGNGSWLSRRIVNVADGIGDHDAATVGQLKDYNTTITNKYDGEFTKYQKAGLVAGKVTKSTGIALGQDATLTNAGSSIAIGKATVDQTNVKVTGNEGEGPWNGIAIGGDKTKVVDSANGIAIGAYSEVTKSNFGSAYGPGATLTNSTHSSAYGWNSDVTNSESATAVGPQSSVWKSDYSSAFGYLARVTANPEHKDEFGFLTDKENLALGAFSKVEGASGSVALGAYSAVADGENNIVSVGNAANGLYRKITNVADGVNAHDAATVGQMNVADQKVKDSVTSTFDNKFKDLQNSLNASGNDSAANALALGDLKTSGITAGTVDGNGSVAISGKNSSGANKAQISGDGIYGAVAVGPNTRINWTGEEGWGMIAIGDGATVNQSFMGALVGAKSTLDNSKYAVGFGDNLTIRDSYAGTSIGNTANIINSHAGTALGATTKVLGADRAVALGSGSVAVENDTISVGRSDEDVKKYNAYVDQYNKEMEQKHPGDDNYKLATLQEGNNIYRRITNVAAGTSDHDATIVGQFKGANGSDFLKAVGKLDWKYAADNADKFNKLAADFASGKFDNLLNPSSTFDVSKISALSLAADVPTSILKEQADTTATGTTNGRNPSETDSGNIGGWTTTGTETTTNGNVTVNGKLSANGGLDVGTTDKNANLNVHGNATVDKTLNVKGDLMVGEGDKAINVGESIKKNSDSIKANQAAIEQNTNDIKSLGTSVANLGDEVDSVGAISAALAGLHPLDYGGKDSKFQISAALGSYDGTRAAALGGFYNANRDTLISFGVSTNLNGDARKTAANIGATFRVGQGNSKEIPDDVASLRDEVVSLKAENATYKDRMDEMEKQLQELLKASKKN